MKKKPRYFTIYFTMNYEGNTVVINYDELNVIEYTGRYVSRDVYLKKLKDKYAVFGYNNFKITNIIEYKTESDYLDYVLPLE